MNGHTYTITATPNTDGDTIHRAVCACGWRSRGYLEAEPANGEALEHVWL